MASSEIPRRAALAVTLAGVRPGRQCHDSPRIWSNGESPTLSQEDAVKPYYQDDATTLLPWGCFGRDRRWLNTSLTPLITDPPYSSAGHHQGRPNQ